MRIIVIVFMTVVATACGFANTATSALTGQPTEYRFADGVRCYYSQSGSMSCVVVK